jgi:hypothetical protein
MWQTINTAGTPKSKLKAVLWIDSPAPHAQHQRRIKCHNGSESTHGPAWLIHCWYNTEAVAAKLAFGFQTVRPRLNNNNKACAACERASQHGAHGGSVANAMVHTSLFMISITRFQTSVARAQQKQPMTLTEPQCMSYGALATSSHQRC